MKKLVNVFLFSGTGSVCCEQMNGQQTNKTKTGQVQADKWKNKLTPNEYDIMVNKGTEPPFKNAYWNNHEKGVYISAATGEVLFSSADKFDSGTGWPSFVKPVNSNKIAIVTDNSYGMERTEVVEKVQVYTLATYLTTALRPRWQKVLHELWCA
jgi:peptide-methionine (R)-S-oxide reductase